MAAILSAEGGLVLIFPTLGGDVEAVAINDLLQVYLSSKLMSAVTRVNI